MSAMRVIVVIVVWIMTRAACVDSFNIFSMVSAPINQNSATVSVQKTSIMVVLGCGIDYIQEDRVLSAIEYANAMDTPIVWFLTGGVKNSMHTNINANTRTEASIMAEKIHERNVVLDEKAENTAENFANLKKWIETNIITKEGNELNLTPSFPSTTSAEFITTGSSPTPNGSGSLQTPDIVITTSEYHKVRAEKIFNGIFKDASFKIQPKWNLGSKACPTCWVDEGIHMVNVNNDVNKAIAKNKM